jgi:fructose-1-phosphate kinase PfkB-like protein
MNEDSICKHCKKPVIDHTNEELFSCKLEIEKKMKLLKQNREELMILMKLKVANFTE